MKNVSFNQMGGKNMNIYTIALFGHRDIDHFWDVERELELAIRTVLAKEEYINFLVGRHGDFDILAASVIRRVRKSMGGEGSSMTLVLPYMMSEYRNNKTSFAEYYDEIEICDEATRGHYKNAIVLRNRCMVDRANLVICYVKQRKGGAYAALSYAQKQGKEIVNLAGQDKNEEN